MTNKQRIAEISKLLKDSGFVFTRVTKHGNAYVKDVYTGKEYKLETVPF